MEPIKLLCEERRFVIEMIKAYKKEPMLWQQNHPNFNSKFAREKAYSRVVTHLKKYCVDVDIKFIRRKINMLRKSLRFEWQKVQASRKSAKTPNDVYIPTLWYYELLSFLVGYDVEDDIELNEDEDFRWTRKHMEFLIELYKQYPCLYIQADSHAVRERSIAYEDIRKKLSTLIGQEFSEIFIRKKIAMIRSQFFKVHKKYMKRRQNSDKILEDIWWAYEYLTFLIPHFHGTKGQENVITKSNIQYSSDAGDFNANDDVDSLVEEKTAIDGEIESKVEITNTLLQPLRDDLHDTNSVENRTILSSIGEESNPLKIGRLSPNPSIGLLNGDQDIFDTISRNVGHQLRQMTEQQREIAERVIKDIMYYGQMEDLTPESRLILDGY